MGSGNKLCQYIDMKKDKNNDSNNNNNVWVRRTQSVSESSQHSSVNIFRSQRSLDMHQHRRRIKSVGEASIEHQARIKTLKDYGVVPKPSLLRAHTLDRPSRRRYSSLNRRNISVEEDFLPAMSAMWSEQRGVSFKSTRRPRVLSVDSGHCGTFRRKDEDDGYLRSSCSTECKHSLDSETADHTSAVSIDEEPVFVFDQDDEKLKEDDNLNMSLYDNVCSERTTLPRVHQTPPTGVFNQTYALIFPESSQQPSNIKAKVKEGKKDNGSITSETSSGFQSDFNESPRSQSQLQNNFLAII